jgi:PKD repeat protein
MGRSLSFCVVLALLVLASAALVTPVLGAMHQPIISWGSDQYGQVSQMPTDTGYTAIAAGDSHSLALRADGSIVSWGSDFSGEVSRTPSGTGFTAVAAGWEYSVALRADGSIVSWGEDSYRKVSGTPSGTGFTAIASGFDNNVALRADGSIVSWGYTFSNAPSGTGFIAIAAGDSHCLALRANGSIVSWGSDNYGQVSQTPSGTGFTAVAAGWMNSVALRADGSIVSWGCDDYGAVSGTPSGTGFIAIAAGDSHCLALRADGSIVSWGWDGNGLVSQTPNGTGFVAVAAGGQHNLALLGVPSIELETSVSVDGGITWLDADAAPGPYLPIGTPPRFRFTATNTGSFTLSNVTVTDPVIGPIALPATTLEPGASASNVTIGAWAEGAYAATATAAATYGTQTVTASDPVHYLGIDRPVAGFTANVTSGMAPLAVRFTNTSSGPGISGFDWDFGDGGTSTVENPEHTFASPGRYIVNLTVTSPAGSNSTTVNVTATEPVLVANPDVYTTAEDTPLVVDAPGVLANDTYFGARTAARVAGPSHGTVDLAGNGSFTYTPAPNFHGTDSFTYAMTAGSYTSDPATVSITVTGVNDPPIADFTLSPAAPTVLGPVAFTDGSTDDGTIVDWSWTFGDGATSSGQNPTHQYSAPGYYRVNLTVTDDDRASSTRTRMVRVTSTPPPAAVPQAIASWGSDGYLSVPQAPGGAEYTAISAGMYYDLALRADGSIAWWGALSGLPETNQHPELCPPSGTGFTAVAAGYYHGVAIRANGSLVTWGISWDDLAATTPPGTGFVAVAAGEFHSIALRDDGSVVCWGSLNQYPQPPAGTGFVAVAAGDSHNLALRADGTIVSWGGDDGGVVSQTPTDAGYTAIAAGAGHSLALRADGSIASWGDDTYGQVSQTPAGTGFTAIADGYGHCLAVRADGSIVSWGDDTHGEVSRTSPGTGFTAVAAGIEHSVALVVPAPAITITVLLNGLDANASAMQSIPAGANITWTYTVTNTGNVPLSEIVVVDEPGGISGGNVTVGTIATLAAGASANLTRNATATFGQYASTGTATGVYENRTVTASYPCQYSGGLGGTGTPPTLGQVVPPPVADFISNASSGTAPLTVQFTDRSTGIIDSRCWTFGDGGTSTEMNPTHTFTAAGSYTVNLTVANRAGSNSTARTVIATDRPMITAGFTANVTSGFAPLIVSFTDASSGFVTFRSWEFGDGATSTELNPVHTYTTPGTYTARLLVSNGQVTDSETRTITVEERGTPLGSGRGYFLVLTDPAGASIYIEGISGERTLIGNTTSGPLNVTICLTCTPVRRIIANLTGYDDAVFEIVNYPPEDMTVPVGLTLVPVAANATVTVPGGSGVPRDLDGDGFCEDVNGNGRRDFADVVLYFNQMTWIAANEPVVPFDYNGNGRIDFADVVWLFTHL